MFGNRVGDTGTVLRDYAVADGSSSRGKDNSDLLLPKDETIIPSKISYLPGQGSKGYAEAYQVLYEKPVTRLDGYSSKTVNYNVRPHVLRSDATKEEQLKKKQVSFGQSLDFLSICERNRGAY